MVQLASHESLLKAPDLKLIGMRFARYPPSDSTKVLRINTVGPNTNRNKTRMMARTMLVLESHWIPRCTPVTAEMTNSAVMTAITRIATVTELGTSHR